MDGVYETVDIIGRTWEAKDLITTAQPFSYVSGATHDEMTFFLDGETWIASYPREGSWASVSYGHIPYGTITFGRFRMTVTNAVYPELIRDIGMYIQGSVGAIARPTP
jgi:hypothetical protein